MLIENDLKDWWDILRGKPIPHNAKQETVAEAMVLRAALLAAFKKEPDKIKIFVYIIPPLMRISGGGGDKETKNSVLELVTDQKLYKKTDQSILTIYRGDESWRISFRTVLPEFADKEVSLVITDNQTKQVVYTNNEKLEEDEDEETWEFDIPLPTCLNLTQSYSIEIFKEK